MTQPNPIDHLKLVKYHAYRVAITTSEPLDDLYQEGCIGLMKACERYNPSAGEFASYARQWIRGEMYRYIRRQIGRKDNKGVLQPTAWYKRISFDSIVDVNDRFPDLQECDRVYSADNWEAMATVWDSAWDKEQTDRQVLQLCAINGLKRCEAAEILDVSAMTITRWYRSAVTRLKWAYLFAIAETTGDEFSD